VDLEFHTILISRDGREIPIDCNGAPIRDLNGNVSGAVIVFHDVSRQRSIARERELLLAKERTARESAEEANALKDDFLATVSHELRTPLNAILGWAAMLKRTPSDTAAVEKALSIIERNATAQNRIIGDILDVSRIVSGKLELDLRPLDLRQIVVEVAESLQPAAKSKSITLEVEISDEKARVLGDPGRLSQVFWNLISNAIKFTMEGGSVTVRLFGGNDVTVEVEDTGVGLDPQAVPLIFERFRQVDSSIKRAHGGLGLGLAIVQHLVELHNGSVEVQSEGSGQGTRFTIRLPRERAATNDGQDAGAEPETDLSALRILVVDDDPDSLEVSCFMLERFGAITRSAETCSDALQICVDWRPDVLVSDLGMPLEDGYDLISRIRRMNPGGRRSIPSIALTAYAGEKIRQTALAAGYDAHVAKPVDGSMLAAMVKSVCARSERQEENVQ
jgi:signal transduction histidine kinase/CheY-like chemotaxis protein